MADLRGELAGNRGLIYCPSGSGTSTTCLRWEAARRQAQTGHRRRAREHMSPTAATRVHGRHLPPFGPALGPHTSDHVGMRQLK